MKKELFFAIIFGLLVGLTITYGVYRARNATSQNETSALDASPKPTTNPDELTNLVIHSPSDEGLVSVADQTIAGTTDPNSFVVVFVNNDENITTADETGAFSVSVTLENGSNIITIFAINEDGQTTQKELVVVFSTQPLDISSEDATKSAQTETSPSPATQN